MNNNILVLTYWSFKDALIQNYTLPYVKMIRENIAPNSAIYLFTIEQKQHRISQQEWNYLKKEFLKEQGIHILRTRYYKFGIIAILSLIYTVFLMTLLCVFKKIKIIHTWCTPAGALGYILSIVTGKKLILDSFEPHADLMLETKTWSRNSFSYKLLFWFEKKQAKRASAVITNTTSMRNYSIEKYHVDFKKMYTKPACVNLELFDYSKISINETKNQLFLNNKIILVYAGKIGGLYFENELFDFIKVAYTFWGDRFRFLFLTNTSEQVIECNVLRCNFPRNIVINFFVSPIDVPKYLALADFAINPTKPVPSRKYSAPIKNAEYWAMGLPVIILQNIADDSDIIESNNIGYVLKDTTEQEYSIAIKKIDALLKEERTLLKGKIRIIAEDLRSYDKAKCVYSKLYLLPLI